MDKEIGFHYSISDEQLEAHKKWSVEDILKWLHETNRLIHTFQTAEEKNNKFLFKGDKYGIYTPKNIKTKQP